MIDGFFIAMILIYKRFFNMFDFDRQKILNIDCDRHFVLFGSTKIFKFEL